MKIAVVGAAGQLGVDVVNAFLQNGDEVTSFSHAKMELTDFDSVTTRLKDLRPHVVVNTAAMHHVENCEREPQKAFAVNGLGARNLSLASRGIDATLMHVSTDYVFDGAKTDPYQETDVPHPLNVYGNTKLSGEHFIRSLCDKHFILRTSAIYGKSACRGKSGLNFVELMLKLARERGKVRVVDSEFVSPTRTTEIAQQMVALSRSDLYGLYHATSEGSCSWHEFAAEIFRLTGTKTTLEVASPNEFPAKVPRPIYSVLENAALKRHGLNLFKPWQQGLQEYFLPTK